MEAVTDAPSSTVLLINLEELNAGSSLVQPTWSTVGCRKRTLFPPCVVVVFPAPALSPSSLTSGLLTLWTVNGPFSPGPTHPLSTEKQSGSSKFNPVSALFGLLSRTVAVRLSTPASHCLVSCTSFRGMGNAIVVFNRSLISVVSESSVRTPSVDRRFRFKIWICC